MVVIKGIGLARMRNALFIQFHQGGKTIVSRNNPATLLVQTQYDDYVAKLTELEGLFKTAVSNPITAQIEALDARRDRAAIGLGLQVKGFINHYDPAMVDAATLLLDNLNLYGSEISKETYQEETTLIRSLVTDWQTKPELVNAVDVLGLTHWTTELKAINEEFDLKFMDRNEDYSGVSPEAVKAKRTEVTTAYYALRNRLNAYAEIEGTEIYTTTINEFNTLIDQSNLTLRGRHAKPAEVVNP